MSRLAFISRSASLRFLRRLTHKVIEDFSLHSLDLKAVTRAHRGPVFRVRGLAQLLEEVLQFGDPLAGHPQLFVVADHATSNMPRTAPSRLVCQTAMRSRISSFESMPSQSQNTLAP